jgi:hypothetical protein
MKEESIIYCDESGNSGANYLDQSQPFYVLAGWAVPLNSLVDASVFVEKTRQRYFRQRKELKAGAFLRTEQGKKRAVEFIRGMGASGCFPLTVVAEKRYCVAAKIVETFLDPAFNKILRAGFTWDTRTKKELANTLMARLPSDVLDHFAEAYREPSHEAFLACLNEILNAAKVFVNPELSACMEGSHAEIVAISESEDPEGSLLGKMSQSVNAPALMSFFLLVEHLARSGVIDVIKVVHDEQAVFEHDMKEMFRLHNGASDFLVNIPGSDIPYSSLKHIPVFELVSSSSCELIQASDVLAGVINHLMMIAKLGQVPTPADMELAKVTIPGFFMDGLCVTWFIGSECQQKKLVMSFILPSVARSSKVSEKTERPPLLHDGGKMFPVVGDEAGKLKTSRKVFKWDLPVYGLRGVQSGALMMVNTGDFVIEGETYDGVLILFTSSEKATTMLRCWESGELSEPQEVVKFGPKELPLLIRMLEGASKTVKVMVLDPGQNEGDKKFHHLEHVIMGLTQLLNRAKRVFSGGLDKVMIQNHDVSGTKVMTILTSAGDYGALLSPDGKQYRGKTRELALAALIEGESLGLSSVIVNGGKA